MMVDAMWAKEHALVRPGLVARLIPHGSLWPSRLPAIFLIVLILTGCGAINPGKFKGIERTDSDENYYLLKNLWLTAGSAAHPRQDFDHTVQESVNLVFVPANEKNHYVSRTKWIDPSGQEYRVIRQTHEKTTDEREGDARPKGGTTRLHSVSTKELYAHKPGLWKVELYLDDVLARRLTFSVF
jgi:hypothetical protein